ncbi:MAG: hypothetical protein WBC44_01260 [Planctomycetaceae bacterium]
MERIPNLRLLVTSASTGLASIALVTFFRRLVAAPLRDLPAGETIVYTALFATACFAVSGLSARQLSPLWTRAAIPPVSTLVLTLVFLAGLSTVPVTILAGSLVATAAVGLMTLTVRLETSHAARVNAECDDVDPPERTVTEEPYRAIRDDDEHGPDSQKSDDPLVKLVRTNAAGGERITGSIRFETAPGETAKTLHVPLWPPLTGVPSVQCELNGIDGRVSVPYAKSHGFRIEVRLPEAVDEPLEGAVRFVAECEESSAAA